MEKEKEDEKVELLGNARSTDFYKKRPRCKDCAHYSFYKADPVLIFASPKHRCTKAVNLVTGDTIETDCYAMRHERCECGPDGTLFEPASPKDKPTPDPAPPEEPDTSIGWKALLVLAALAILALAYWAYEQETDQPRVIQTREVSVKKVSAKDGSCCVTARTQLLAIGKRSVWQVEVSHSDWRDCGNDCEKALRRALAE